VPIFSHRSSPFLPLQMFISFRCCKVSLAACCCFGLPQGLLTQCFLFFDTTCTSDFLMFLCLPFPPLIPARSISRSWVQTRARCQCSWSWAHFPPSPLVNLSPSVRAGVCLPHLSYGRRCFIYSMTACSIRGFSGPVFFLTGVHSPRDLVSKSPFPPASVDTLFNPFSY